MHSCLSILDSIVDFHTIDHLNNRLTMAVEMSTLEWIPASLLPEDEFPFVFLRFSAASSCPSFVFSFCDDRIPHR